MGKTVTEITSDIISQLKLLDPDISAEVGTPERKIIDSVAEQIALAYADIEVLNTQHDVDMMSGGRLDQFLSLFGFGRKLPTRAVGYVTFSRSTPANANILIDRGTQLQARQDDGNYIPVTFVTVEAAVIPTGGTSVDIAVECSLPGTIGNVPAGAITAFAGVVPIGGVSSISNAQPITGGTDGETDAEFKVRFKNTLFRNLSGTTDQYLALAVSLPSVAKANVVGPVSRHVEYVEIPPRNDYNTTTDFDPSGNRYPNKRTTAVSAIPYSKWTYSTDFFLSNGATGSNAIYYRHGVDYVYNNPPRYDGDAVNRITSATAATPIVITTESAHGLSANDIVIVQSVNNVTGANGVYRVKAALSTTTFSLGTLADYTVSVAGTGTTGNTGICYKPVYYKPNITAINMRTDALSTSGTRSAADGSAAYINNNPNASGIYTGSRAYTSLANSVDNPTVLLFEHSYISKNSRNDYLQRILNCVDVFIDGTNPISVISSETLSDTKFQTGTSTNYLYASNYERVLDSTTPASGNIFMTPLFQPMIDVPDTITIGSTVFYKAKYYYGGSYYYDSEHTILANYWAVRDKTNLRGTVRARNGIEFATGVNGNTIDGGFDLKPENLYGVPFLLENYSYDQNISDLQALCERHKQISTDVLVHQTKYRYFKFYLTIMYSPGASPSVVNQNIQNAIDAFFRSQYYGTVIQLSDILQVVHNAIGVDNVQWTADIDPTLVVTSGNSSKKKKIVEVRPNGESFLTPYNYTYDADFYLEDCELPAVPTNGVDTTALLSINRRVQNTWSR